MLEHSEYPKVLVIDAMPFSRTTNSGIVKSNLFQGWPSNRLAQIDYSNTRPEFDVCNHYWILKKWDILKGLVGKAPLADLPIPEKIYEYFSSGQHDPEYDSRHAIERQLSVLPLKLRLLIGETIFRLPSLLSAPLRDWIDYFQPDVIFSLISPPTILRTVVKVSQWRNIPIVPYFTDDWITTQYRDDPLLRIWHRRSMQHWFNECLKRSPIVITNCDAMNEEYTRRYGGHFETFMNLVNYSEAACIDQKTNNDGVVRFAFIGSLEPERWRSLRAIGEALLYLNATGIRGELLIYSFPDHIEKYRTALTLEPVMRIMGTASYDQVLEIQRESDVLVHVECFDKAIREYTKYSVSTKITQYMMAGTCIFAYGPGEVASMRCLSDTGAGITVGDENPEVLRTVLSKLITDKDLRQSTVKCAREIVIEKNEGFRQRKKFKQTVIDSCNAWKSNKSQ